jgi:hypothetical protein
MNSPRRSRLHHGFTAKESSPEAGDSDGGDGARPMSYYLLREGGEPVALVASIDLACELMFSQAPGYYIVDEIHADPLDSGPGARVGRRSTRPSDGRDGDGPRMGSGSTIPSRHKVARRTDPQRR